MSHIEDVRNYFKSLDWPRCKRNPVRARQRRNLPGRVDPRPDQGTRTFAHMPQVFGHLFLIWHSKKRASAKPGQIRSPHNGSCGEPTAPKKPLTWRSALGRSLPS